MTRSTREYKSDKAGKGFVNSLINSLPFEAHVPGYQYCGPGTKLKKRLDRSDEGINPLDAACRDHDIVYATSKYLSDRHKADKMLENRAWERFKVEDSSRKEKLVAYAVTNAMKAKRKKGMGCKRKRVKNNGLSALGSLMSGGVSVYNAVQNSKRKKDNGVGSHWVAFHKNKDKVVYFDSFGDLPPIELQHYFKQFKKVYNYSNYQDFNTFNCGHLCLEFLQCMNLLH
ncbi:hypothetical protein QTP88_019557 [Uroleucon formosanum]